MSLNIALAIAGVAVLPTLALTAALDFVAPDYGWVASPSWLASYGIMRRYYRSRGWRWRFLGADAKVPLLEGTWVGTVLLLEVPKGNQLTSRFQTGKPSLCCITISQTLTSISIGLETSFSRSASQMASLGLNGASGVPELRYIYLAESRDFEQSEQGDEVADESRFPVHRGYASLDGQRLVPPPRATPQSLREKASSALVNTAKSPNSTTRLSGEYRAWRPFHAGRLDVTLLTRDKLTLAEAVEQGLPDAIQQRYSVSVTGVPAASQTHSLESGDATAPGPDVSPPVDLVAHESDEAANSVREPGDN